MDATPQTMILFPLAGLASAAGLYWMGFTKPSALDGSPKRSIGLTWVDLVAGGVLTILGILVAQTILSLMRHSAGREAPSPLPYVGQALVAQIMIQGPMVGYLFWRVGERHHGFRDLGLWPPRPLRDSYVVLVALFCALPMVLGCNVLVTWMGEGWFGITPPEVGHDLLRELGKTESTWTMAGLLLSAVILAPLLEECIFRGFIQTCLQEGLGWSRRWYAILMVSFAFTAMHTGIPWQFWPSIFILSMVMGWVYERTGRLTISILVHVGFNAINTMIELGKRIWE